MVDAPSIELVNAAEKLAEVGDRLVSRLRSQAHVACVEMTMVEDNAERVRTALLKLKKDDD